MAVVVGAPLVENFVGCAVLTWAGDPLGSAPLAQTPYVFARPASIDPKTDPDTKSVAPVLKFEEKRLIFNSLALVLAHE
jgi:hypothetical protein